jgi:predicted PolB exonuclease-like 3'-5' exonuclease
MNLYIDIETIPDQSKDARSVIEQSISHPANMSKPETIEKWRQEQLPALVEEQYRKTGLDGTVGEIICIGYAFDDEPAECIGRHVGGSEEVLLREFVKVISDRKFAKQGQPEQITWIGHNIAGFDLRYIWQRCVVNGVKIFIPYDAKPWSSNVFDTLYHWTGINKAGGSLDRICKAMGLEGKGDIDGSQVWPLVQAGEYDKVFEYCKSDVEKTRQLHKRMTFK